MEDTLYIRSQAIAFRNRKRQEWIEGKIPEKDYWLIECMDVMFPNDGQKEEA